METEEINDEDFEEKDTWYRGPIRIIIMLFLLLIISMWVFSYYAVKIDPQPGRIPGINEVFIQNFEVDISNKKIITKNDFYGLINPTDPVIKQTADRIVNIACESSSKVCHAKAVYYFVRDNFQYVSDPNAFEYVKDARESLVTGNGDCEDGSILTANLLEAVGIQAEFVFVPRHVYIQAYLPEAAKRYKNKEGWVSLDVTCKNCEFGEIPV